MGVKSIPLKKFVKFLKSIGLQQIRTNSSHHLYGYPEAEKKLLRPVTVDTNYKVTLRMFKENLEGFSKLV